MILFIATFLYSLYIFRSTSNDDDKNKSAKKSSSANQTQAKFKSKNAGRQKSAHLYKHAMNAKKFVYDTLLVGLSLNPVQEKYHKIKIIPYKSQVAIIVQGVYFNEDRKRFLQLVVDSLMHNPKPISPCPIFLKLAKVNETPPNGWTIGKVTTPNMPKSSVPVEIDLK